MKVWFFGFSTTPPAAHWRRCPVIEESMCVDLIKFASWAPVVVLLACRPQAPAQTATSADGVSIHYEKNGSGTPALVFVHGWCCDGTYWLNQVPYLSDRHTVVTIDLAGHGKSGMSRKSYTMGAFAEDVVPVVGELHLDQVVLIGHSMGGAVVVEAARRIPDGVLGIVRVDTLQDPEFQPTQASVGEFLAPFRSYFQIAMRKLVQVSFFLPQSDPAIVQKVANDLAAEPPEVGISAVKKNNEWAIRDRSGALRQLRVPICSINSDLFPTNVEAFLGARHPAGSGRTHRVEVQRTATQDEPCHTNMSEGKNGL
jgi:pimeloyl-ACP methyl ester carboxylesterase